jgi:hypothetical protein
MARKTTTFHATNYGRFGDSLPTDSEGYCHLTVKGWRDAGYSTEEAREKAKAAKEAVREADAALAEWRNA